MKIKLLIWSTYLLVMGSLFGQNQSPCFAKKRMCNNRLYTDANKKVAFDEEKQTYLVKSDLRTPFDGTCETCYRNNVLKERITIVNGKRDGSDSSFYASGCIQSTQQYAMGKKNGRFLFYFDSTGRISNEGNYLQDKKQGEFLWLEANGDSISCENYVNDLKSGEQREYYVGGKIGKVVQYQNGLMHGSHRTYNINGKIEIDISYKEGKNHGVWRYFYENGKEIKIETWNNGLKDGLFLFSDDKGGIIKKESFKKNIADGEFIENYPNGKLKHQIIYKAGEIIREQKIDDYGKTTYTFDKALSKAKEKEDKKKANEGTVDDDIQDVIDEKEKKGKKGKKKKKD